MSTFHKDYAEKPTLISSPVDIAPHLTWSTTRLKALAMKKNCSRPAKANNAKHAKKSWLFEFLSYF